MNANKLADDIVTCTTDPLHKQCSDMLRQLQKEKEQQADRIAELEKCIEFGYKDAMDIVVLNNLGAEDNHWFKWAKSLIDIDYIAPQPIEKPSQTNAGETWTVCNGCNQRVTGDSIHTCSPQLKSLSDEEIEVLASKNLCYQIEGSEVSGVFNFARAIEKRHGIK